MNQQFVAVAVAILFSFSGLATAQEVTWQDDLESAQKLAAKENKLILLHFSAEWCRPCKQLETFVFSSSIVGKAIHERLVPVHIDTDLHPELVKKFSITEIPTDIVIAPNGNVITKRKSPKDADNYIRMVKSLPSTESALDQQNIELAQKIEQVVAASKPDLVTSSNDFAVAKPSHSQPAPATEASKLAAKYAAVKRPQVGHVTSETLRPAETAKNDFSVSNTKPQRVINDQFFVEKSTAATSASAEDVMETDKKDFKPEIAMRKPQQLATAKIDNPFKESAAKQRAARGLNGNNAARILTPDFGKAKIAAANDKKRTSQITNGQNNSPTQRSAMSTNRAARMAMAPNALEMKSRSSVDATEKAKAQIQTNEPKQPVAFVLNGKCPVTLVQSGKWLAGDPKFGCVHRGRTYLFADQEKLAAFQQAPETFSPILAGYDPVVFHERGELVVGKEQHGVFMGKSPDHRIVLFHSQETRERFQASPQEFMSTIHTALKQSDSKLR